MTNFEFSSLSLKNSFKNIFLIFLFGNIHFFYKNLSVHVHTQKEITMRFDWACLSMKISRLSFLQKSEMEPKFSFLSGGHRSHPHRPDFGCRCWSRRIFVWPSAVAGWNYSCRFSGRSRRFGPEDPSTRTRTSSWHPAVFPEALKCWHESEDAVAVAAGVVDAVAVAPVAVAVVLQQVLLMSFDPGHFADCFWPATGPGRVCNRQWPLLIFYTKYFYILILYV